MGYFEPQWLTLCLFLSGPQFSFLETGYPELMRGSGVQRPACGTQRTQLTVCFFSNSLQTRAATWASFCKWRRGWGSENAESKEGWGN